MYKNSVSVCFLYDRERADEKFEDFENQRDHSK